MGVKNKLSVIQNIVRRLMKAPWTIKVGIVEQTVKCATI